MECYEIHNFDNPNFVVIQGDSFPYVINVYNGEVDKIYFSSAELLFTKEFVKEDNRFTLDLQPGETINFSVGQHYFDITIYFNNKVKTIVQNAIIEVLEKVNGTDIEVPIVVPEGYFKPEGTKEITENGEHDVREFEKVNVLVLESIPEGYIKPEGTLDITENGKHNVTIYEEVDVNVPIPDGYIVPSGKVEIKSTDEVDVTEYAKAQIVDENLKAENIAENVKVLGITGMFKGGIDTSDATATSDDILKGKTAYVNEQKLVGTIEDYDYSNSEGVRPEIDEFLENTLTEYTNNRVTKLGNSKFCTNQSLVTVNFANVEEIGDRCFSGCAKLANVNMPKVKTVMGYAFNSTLITGESPMFNSIETLGMNAFWSCSNLGDVNMPNLVSGIPQNAFNNSGLTSFRADKVVCETATLSGNTAFSNCSKLEYVHFDKLQIVGTQWFNSCKALKKAEFNSVKTFRGYAFQGCSALEVLIIRTPDVVASIDSNMFHSFTFTGTVYVPDNMVDQYRISTNWSVYADQIKPLSELEIE